MFRKRIGLQFLSIFTWLRNQTEFIGQSAMPVEGTGQRKQQKRVEEGALK